MLFKNQFKLSNLRWFEHNCQMSLQTLMRVNSEYQLRVGDIADRRKGKSTCCRTPIFLEKCREVQVIYLPELQIDEKFMPNIGN